MLLLWGCDIDAYKNVEDLRKRFHIEYLGQLKYAGTSKIVLKPISVCDIVLMGSHILKRLQWPIGRVVELFLAEDDVIRVIKLKTKFNIIARSLQCVLPLNIPGTNDNPLMGNKLHKTNSIKQCF